MLLERINKMLERKILQKPLCCCEIIWLKSFKNLLFSCWWLNRSFFSTDEQYSALGIGELFHLTSLPKWSMQYRCLDLSNRSIHPAANAEWLMDRFSLMWVFPMKYERNRSMKKVFSPRKVYHRNLALGHYKSLL